MSNLDVKDFIIEEDCSMLEAMQLLDRLARKVLFIVRDGKLVSV